MHNVLSHHTRVSDTPLSSYHLLILSSYPLLGALAWSLHTLCTAHGQPTQSVALASFVRVVVGACKTLAPHTLLFTPTSDKVQGLDSCVL